MRGIILDSYLQPGSYPEPYPSPIPDPHANVHTPSVRPPPMYYNFHGRGWMFFGAGSKTFLERQESPAPCGGMPVRGRLGWMDPPIGLGGDLTRDGAHMHIGCRGFHRELVPIPSLISSPIARTPHAWIPNAHQSSTTIPGPSLLCLQGSTPTLIPSDVGPEWLQVYANPKAAKR